MVGCAVAWSVEVGLDVEHVPPAAPLEILPVAFSMAERDWLMHMAAEQQAYGFYRLWTLKEAFVKATGQGLGEDAAYPYFAFDPLRVTAPAGAGNEDSRWHFRQWSLGRSHILAIAWRDAADARVEQRNVCLKTMLRNRREWLDG